MKKALHRITALLLLLCISAGVQSYLHFDIGQLICKLTSGERNPTELCAVKLPVKAFSGLAQETEITVNGRLYDVNSYVVVNDTAIVWCWRDTDEENLVAGIVSVFEHTSQFTARDTTNNHFSKYRVYVPDGKILNQPIYLHSYVLTTTQKCSYSRTHAVIKHRSTKVIKPPPQAPQPVLLA